MNLETFLNQNSSKELIAHIAEAIEHTKLLGQSLSLAHLVLSLLDDDKVKERLGSTILEVASKNLQSQIDDLQNQKGGQFQLNSPDLLKAACQLALDFNAKEGKVTPMNMLQSCLNEQHFLKNSIALKTIELLRAAGLTIESLQPGNSNKEDQAKRADYTYYSLGFGTDLTAMARAGYWKVSPLVGMEEALRRMTVSISSGWESVALVGEPGVGKSSLIYGLAYYIANKKRPLILPEMDNYTIVSISPMDLLSGAGVRGALEERLQKLLSFFRQHPMVIPFFDEFHRLLDQDDPSSKTIATALKPPMASGAFRCIGATTDHEYVQYIANDRALSSRFTKVLIQEPDEDLTVQIVKGAAPNLIPAPARELKITFEDDAIRRGVHVTSTYQRADRQPRKTIQLMRRVVAQVAYDLKQDTGRGTTITGEDVVNIFSDISGIPVDNLVEDRDEFYQVLNHKLKEQIIGQPQAVDTVTKWLALQAKGWVGSKRPKGRFLFVGPPGVGKTELAMKIAEEVMRDRGSLIVKNMAEYQGEGARSRFMGSDPGYVGYGTTSTIYTKILMRPYSVIVLDEIEKAHSSLSNPLLSVLDGQGEDAAGKWVDFSQSIIIMTSNALHKQMNLQELTEKLIKQKVEASKEISEEQLNDENTENGSSKMKIPIAKAPIDLSENELRKKLVELRGFWQEPLVDRIDQIVFFNSLDEISLNKILSLMIEKRQEEVAKPLPESLFDPVIQKKIIKGLLEKTEGEISARGLDRALLKWLIDSQNL